MVSVMTIVKGHRCVAVIFMCAVIVVCCAACGGTSLEGDLDSLQASVGLKINKYQIIIPSDSSPELADKANSLAYKIEESIWVTCRVYSDSSQPPADMYALPIYIGNAKGKLEQERGGLRRDDYIYSATDERIILGGLSHSASIAAIDRFIEDVLPYCESTNIFEYQGDFEYRHTYETPSFKLCGFDLDDYSICALADEESHEMTMARAMRDGISDLTGVYPQIVSAEAQSTGHKQIVLQKNGTGTVSITFNGEDILLTAPDTYGLSLLCSMFCERLSECVARGDAYMDITEAVTCTYSAPKLKLFVAYQPERSVSGALSFADTVEAANADIVYFGIMDKEFCQLVRANIKGYEFFVYSMAEDKVLAMAYKAAAFNCSVDFSNASDGIMATDIELVSSGERFKIYSLCENDSTKREECAAKLAELMSSSEENVFGIYAMCDTQKHDVNIGGFHVSQSASLKWADGYRRTSIYVNSSLCCDVSGNDTDGDSLTATVSKLFSKEYSENIGK